MDALRIHDLKKKYADGTVALKGIGFSVQPGEFFALLGPNGAGKSTTIGIVSSLVTKTSGKVTVFGKNLDTERNAVKQQIGLVPQEFNFPMFEKVEDIVVNQAGYYGIPRKQALPRAETLLKKLGLWGKRHTTARMLSGGMKRKLMIVRALMHRPKLLILDEPTAGVDVETRREMWMFFQEMNKEGTTIILTTHYLEEAEQLCDRIVIIDKGVIRADTSKKKLLEQLMAESFIIDIERPLKKAPAIAGYDVRLVDATTLEVVVNKGQDLNTLFCSIEKKGIRVTSMRNKTNRLEELFVNITKEETPGIPKEEKQ